VISIYKNFLLTLRHILESRAACHVPDPERMAREEHGPRACDRWKRNGQVGE
jgi:hypothetical protein